VSSAPAPSNNFGQPLEVLGAATCEDTAIVRGRLDALGVPYRYRDVDLDAGALEIVQTLNAGHRVTPTTLVGDIAAAEPSLERLGELVVATGSDAVVAAPTQLHGDITQWPIPSREGTTDQGTPFRLGSLRGRRQACLFLAHDHGCLECFGYARQLGRHRTAFDAADATTIVAVTSAPETLADWRHGMVPHDVLVGDVDGAWHAAVARHLGLAAGAASLVMLDRFLAPRVVASDPDAGGLPDPSDVVEWLDFLTLECPECSGELPWPTP
jgi:hypothetical protein